MTCSSILRLARAAAFTLCAFAPTAVLADTAGRLTVQGGLDFTLNPFNDFAAGQTARIGGRLYLTAPSLVTYRLVGSEASFANVFEFAGRRLSDSVKAGLGSTVQASVAAAAGLLDFGFVIPHPHEAFRFVSNATNDAGRAPGFGVMLQGDRAARVLLDDFGWLDADYDDMVVEVSVTPIPEPAEWMIMLSGLLLAARAARRRSGA
jgi:hypothetical protein